MKTLMIMILLTILATSQSCTTTCMATDDDTGQCILWDTYCYDYD